MPAGAAPEAGIRLHTALGRQSGQAVFQLILREQLQLLEAKLQILDQGDPVTGYRLLCLTVQRFVDLDHVQQRTVCVADHIQMDFHGETPPARSFGGGVLGSEWIMLSASFSFFRKQKYRAGPYSYTVC